NITEMCFLPLWSVTLQKGGLISCLSLNSSLYSGRFLTELISCWPLSSAKASLLTLCSPLFLPLTSTTYVVIKGDILSSLYFGHSDKWIEIGSPNFSCHNSSVI